MTAQTVTTKNNSSIAQNNRSPILRRPGRRKKIPVLPYLLILPEIIKMLLGLLFIAPLLIGILFSFQSEQELGTYPLHLLSKALICGHLHTDHKDMLSERIPQYVSNESYFGEVTVFRIHG